MSFRGCRREFIKTGGSAVLAASLPIATQGATAAPARRKTSLARYPYEGVSPSNFGAVGDGAADDLKAVIAAIGFAFDKGYPVNGGDLEYAVAGDISVSKRLRPHIIALRLKQIAPANGRNTLRFTDCEQIRIDRLEIDVGGSKGVGNMDHTTGLQVRGGSGHEISDVTVTGNGKLTYVRFWSCADSRFVNIRVHDGMFEDFEMDPAGFRVPDDVVQGIHLADCVNCELVDPIVENLTGNATYFNTAKQVKAFPSMRTRGICGGGNVSCIISNPRVSNVEQGMDFSGSGSGWGNRALQINGGHTIDCGSAGVKLSGAAMDCRVSNHIAERCGMMGFLVNGSPEEEGYRAFDNVFDDCTAIDPGYNDIHFDTDTEPFAHCGWHLNANGFRGVINGTRINDCKAIDQSGFYLEGDDPGWWPVAGATSATMSTPWTGYTGNYQATFTTSAGKVPKTIVLTSGSKTISWPGGLPGPITDPFVSRRPQMRYGFLSDVPDPIRPNRLSNCESVNATIAATKGF